MARLIGIHHRVRKERKEDEGEESENEKTPRGTSVAIKDFETGKTTRLTLRSETEELDFLVGRYVTAWRDAREEEDLSVFFSRHVRQRRRRSTTGFVTCVPEAYEGLQQGDTVVMQMGGSGDRFAYALSNRGRRIGVEVFRIPSNRFAALRGKKGTENDHLLVIDFFERFPGFFYGVTPRERTYLRVSAAFHAFLEAQEDRISCQLRIAHQHRDQVFLTEEGYYPEGRLDEEYKAILIDDPGYTALLKREEEAERKMRQAVRNTEVWKTILSPIPGMGERIAAGIIGPVGNVLRFVVEPDLTGLDQITDDAARRKERRRRVKRAKDRTQSRFVKFCGLHVTSQGLARRRRDAGEEGQYGDYPRQSFYLMIDQFNYQARSPLGQLFIATKKRLRERAPGDDSDSHVHKKAGWRRATRLAEKICRHWVALERARQREISAQPSESSRRAE